MSSASKNLKFFELEQFLEFSLITNSKLICLSFALWRKRENDSSIIYLLFLLPTWCSVGSHQT